jgi:hypothetical protein
MKSERDEPSGERFVRETERDDRRRLQQDIRRIQRRFAKARVETRLTTDEIIGYDEFGLPT